MKYQSSFLRAKNVRSVLWLISLIVLSSLSWTKATAATTIEFIQWWEPELPSGSFREIMDEFEAQNPDIKVSLISGPYSSTRDQIVVGAASGTLSDVVGLDGAWVNDLAKQGAIAPLDDLMNAASYDKEQVADIIQVEGKSYMFPVASFVYPVFINLDLFEQAGLTEMPTTRDEFVDAARKLTDDSKNQYGWVLPLSLQSPNGVQNDVMSWVWASGESMLDNGQPDLTNPAVVDTLKFIQSMYDEGIISPGSFSKKEQDKVEEFVNGKAAMMVSTLAHINMIRERNPDLNFTISELPAIAGYDGPRGLPYAAWGIGVSASSEHQEESWKLVEYLMSPEVNSKLVSIANAFPGNVNAEPDFVSSDELFAKGFEIFQTGYLANEFTGLPVAEELMRMFDEEIQLMLDGQQSAEQASANAQTKWEEQFK